MTWIERELKLAPEDERVLDALEALQRIGPFQVVRRHRVRQRNAYFDTSTEALRAARVAFRRRTEAGAPMATWTLKAEGKVTGRVVARPEIDVVLDADTPPMLALSALRETARGRGATALAEQVGDALAGSPPPQARPLLELDADRRLADLVAPGEGWQVELALDRVRLVGDESYLDLEIEAELKRGDERALEVAESAIAQVGPVRPSPGSKLSRALAHVARQPGG